MWQEKCNNYLNDCSAHMCLPQNLPCYLPPSIFLLCSSCSMSSPSLLPYFSLSFSPTLPAVLLSLSTESPFSALATGHLCLFLCLSPSLSLCHLSQTSPQAFLERMLQLPSSHFPQPLPLLTLFVCSRVPIKSCLCLIIAVIRRCANTCPAVCHQWSSTTEGGSCRGRVSSRQATL